MPCKVCNHPEAPIVMQKVFSGEISYVEAAKRLNLPVSMVWRCFKEHWETQITDDKVVLKLKEARTTDDYIEILKELLKKFIGRVHEAMDLPVTAYNESAVTRLTSELRALMKDILMLEGELKAGPLVQLTVLQTQFNKLTSVLFSTLCPACQRKLLEKLPELAENEQPETSSKNS